MSQLSETMTIAFGDVVNVESIPSRGVTRVEIEIPIEYHVEATELLFGKPAFIFPVASKPAALPNGSAYGVLPFDRALAMVQRSPTPAEPASGAMFGGKRPSTNYVSLAGQVCRDNEAFWQVLRERTEMPVTNEAQAALALRAALNIGSRAELAENARAQAVFDELLIQSKRVPA